MNDAIHQGPEAHDAAEEPSAPAVVPTGHPEIDAALATLEQLPHRAVTEHVATYDAIHHVVRTTLADAGRPEGSGTL